MCQGAVWPGLVSMPLSTFCAAHPPPIMEQLLHLLIKYDSEQVPDPLCLKPSSFRVARFQTVSYKRPHHDYVSYFTRTWQNYSNDVLILFFNMFFLIIQVVSWSTTENLFNFLSCNFKWCGKWPNTPPWNRMSPVIC